jgi:type IV pilus assembly protein PilP
VICIRIYGLSLLWLAGCAEERMPDLTAYVERIHSRPAVGDIETPIKPSPIPAFTYEAKDRRDPFTADRMFLTTQQLNPPKRVVQPERQRPKDVLESYALDSLSMVGSILRDDLRWALVRDQNQVIHRVVVGHYMGQQQGQVIDIQADQIRLLERTPLGHRLHEKMVVLRLGN